MKRKTLAALVASLVGLGLIGGGMFVLNQEASQADPSYERADLVGCKANTTFVSIDSSETAAKLSANEAEKRGGTGRSVFRTYGSVSVGNSSQAPQGPDDFQFDGEGPIKERPAWVMVFPDQEVPIHAPTFAKDAPAYYLAPMVFVVDDRKGSLIGAWSC